MSEHLDRGFDCDFVQKPPDELDSQCPVCNKIIREPYQAICCGTSLCYSCMEEIKEQGENICPVCKNNDKFTTYPNTALRKRLYAQRVYCTHRAKGCEWTGELLKLDEHLNCQPNAENLLVGCQHTVIQCPLEYVGCGIMLSRKDMEEHLKEMAISHQLKQAEQQCSLMKTIAVFQQEIDSLKQSNGLLQEKVSKQQAYLQYREQQFTEAEEKLAKLERYQEMVSRTGMAIGPVRFTMDEFERHKQADDNWFSPHFWTHPQGYKICLCIIANGEGPAQGQYTSVLIHMMKGEFDNQLKWPFRGIIKVQIVDQEGDNENWEQEVHITHRTPDEVANRVMDDQRTKKGWGLFQYIPHSKLEPRYLKNDQLCFQIGQIELK